MTSEELKKIVIAWEIPSLSGSTPPIPGTSETTARVAAGILARARENFKGVASSTVTA
jgi:hypothetical protein